MSSRGTIRWIFGAAIGASGAAIMAGCPSLSYQLCADDPTCAAANADGGGGDGSQGDGSTCDPSKDPSCVSDASGIFVNGASGADSNAGTKESPVKTIGAAVAKATGSKNAVYICAGTYAEHVKVNSSVSLFGGFACADWSYSSTTKPKISPSDAGYALDVESVTSAISITDLEFDSVDGKKPGDSSVAIFVASSSNLTLKRVTATAGNGVAGADPVAVDADAGTAPTGNSATDENGAAACANACAGSVSSSGGRGGDGATTLLGITNGADGGPLLPPDSFGDDGHGGKYSGGCGSGGNGSTAAAADAGAPGATKAGTLSATGWLTNSAAGVGGNGGVAQGGGGGSGGISGSVGGGGGGGCGGCGGAGGAAGNSGGSSFAILVFQSTVTVDTCTLTAGNGADGKAGGSGQSGQTGGGPGAPASLSACQGGAGGNGGAGAGGGGGAGGNAIAIGYVGAKPTVTGPTYAEGTAGAAGAGGTGASSNNGLPGAAGTKADVQELP